MEQASIKVEPLFGSIGWEIKQEGKEEGKVEGKIEVIKAAIQQGLNDELISKITGISITEVAKLRTSMEKGS